MDPYEQKCPLVEPDSTHDRSFKCQIDNFSEFRYSKIQNYLSFHNINAIPIGIKNFDHELLTHIHAYLYHRIPESLI